jgi:hypothetical protein
VLSIEMRTSFNCGLVHCFLLGEFFMCFKGDWSLDRK